MVTDRIAASRTKAWDKIDSQSHQILKVYLNDQAHDPDLLDLLIVGRAKIQPKDSQLIEREFLVRAVIIRPGSGAEEEEGGRGPRLEFWKPLLAQSEPILAPVDVRSYAGRLKGQEETSDNRIL